MRKKIKIEKAHENILQQCAVYLRHSLFAAYRVWSLSRFTAHPRIPSLVFVYSRRQDLKNRPSGEKCTFYHFDIF